VEIPAGPRPLGVQPAIALTGEQWRSLQVLQDYDLTLVRDRLVRDAVMPSGWVDEAILEFRRYLGLRVLENEPLMMFSKPIDNVWHTCLLFSRLYADLCQQAFGTFLHHEPATTPVPDPARCWDAFQMAYERNYGSLNRLWRRPNHG
jgi:hypothetical protein